MCWSTIWENTISGIFVVAFTGICGWIFYQIGIKGKEKGQIATQRKQDIYIPLKHELQKLSSESIDLWKKIEITEIPKIISKNDELVVDENIYQKCTIINNMVSDFNSISSYNEVALILENRFRKKYIEIYGSDTHEEWHYAGGPDEEDVLIDVLDYEIMDFSSYTDSHKNIDKLFSLYNGAEDYWDEINSVSPAEEYITYLFGAALPRKEKAFDGVVNKELLDGKIKPCDYIMRGFKFFKEFEENINIKNKEDLFCKLQELAFNLQEDVQIKIKYIGNKYEKE